MRTGRKLFNNLPKVWYKKNKRDKRLFFFDHYVCVNLFQNLNVTDFLYHLDNRFPVFFFHSTPPNKNMRSRFFSIYHFFLCFSMYVFTNYEVPFLFVLPVFPFFHLSTSHFRPLVLHSTWVSLWVFSTNLTHN